MIMGGVLSHAPRNHPVSVTVDYESGLSITFEEDALAMLLGELTLMHALFKTLSAQAEAARATGQAPPKPAEPTTIPVGVPKVSSDQVKKLFKTKDSMLNTKEDDDNEEE
jgi:hypothetical protein